MVTGSVIRSHNAEPSPLILVGRMRVSNDADCATSDGVEVHLMCRRKGIENPAAL